MKANASVPATDPMLSKNREIYDHSDDEIWQRAVYEPVHDGWHFTNIGGRRALRRIAELVDLKADMQVLDLCCGSGAALRYLKLNYGISATGLDINPSQIARACERTADLEGLQFVVADATNWISENRYDLAFALDSLTLIPDMEGFFSTARKSLNAGGLFALTDVVEGQNLSESMRAFASQEDGIVTLASSQAIAEAMAQSGFDRIEIFSDNAEAVRVFSLIFNRVHSEEGWGELPRDRVDSWKELSARYLAAFQADELGYATVIGRAA
ncbi:MULTISPECIES: class I SAM-dependent methyltransferase [unclassified Novosphingobium]|uniref:SAM-dependent methyltransferase n=1 Tax=unclassified Novosphingobium TaxID=2644732 RepID=UPI0025D05869|nr:MULTISPECIES: class I SAM-dependent methyltransferase [unclassified Novosphingobium]HQV04683.1 methyltransferase domain-containing protein [Novosphingobium sp.]